MARDDRSLDPVLQLAPSGLRASALVGRAAWALESTGGKTRLGNQGGSRSRRFLFWMVPSRVSVRKLKLVVDETVNTCIY